MRVFIHVLTWSVSRMIFFSVIIEFYHFYLSRSQILCPNLSCSPWHLTGLLTAVHKDYFRVVDHRELLFNDIGDRVAQLLHVELLSPVSQCRSNNVRQEMLIVNTHLLFPHDSSLCLVRLNQVVYIFRGLLLYICSRQWWRWCFFFLIKLFVFPFFW